MLISATGATNHTFAHRVIHRNWGEKKPCLPMLEENRLVA